ncbi:MAG: Holliday junction branch migration protein RuvA [Bacilli bacterium]|jgi:Holliday junction DNA helicase RuvA
MYAYLKGTITDQQSTFIILENNQIGYLIYTANPYSFEINKEYKIYVYQHVKEDILAFYGFKTKEEKDLFLKLIEVKGIGPKTALPILATGSIEGIIDAIERENILYLKKFPKIGDKVAKQIILDLKGKFNYEKDNKIEEPSNELVEVLQGLGYKNKVINKILPKININNPLEEQIKEALKLMLK